LKIGPLNYPFGAIPRQIDRLTRIFIEQRSMIWTFWIVYAFGAEFTLDLLGREPPSRVLACIHRHFYTWIFRAKAKCRWLLLLLLMMMMMTMEMWLTNWVTGQSIDQTINQPVSIISEWQRFVRLQLLQLTTITTHSLSHPSTSIIMMSSLYEIYRLSACLSVRPSVYLSFCLSRELRVADSRKITCGPAVLRSERNRP